MKQLTNIEFTYINDSVQSLRLSPYKKYLQEPSLYAIGCGPWTEKYVDLHIENLEQIKIWNADDSIVYKGRNEIKDYFMKNISGPTIKLNIKFEICRVNIARC